MASSRHLKGSVLSRVRDLLKSGVVKEKPVWYDVVAAFPPFLEPDLSREAEPGRVKKIVYSEDTIRRKFFSNYNLEPVSLCEPSAKETTVDRFVAKCQELINEGSDESEAFNKTVGLFEDELDTKKVLTRTSKQPNPKFKESPQTLLELFDIGDEHSIKDE